jgi:hypothetical protein
MNEACNTIDDDGDGRVDEGDMGGALVVACDNGCGDTGTRSCVGGQLTSCTAPPPGAEICDEADNDCDGKIDEEVTTAYYRDADGDGFGAPDLSEAFLGCAPPESGGYVDDATDCDDGNPMRSPGTAEDCTDQLDNNCNGVVNDGCACPEVGAVEPCGSNDGVCTAGMRTCGPNGWTACEGGGPAPQPEFCSGLDEDCDGAVDEGLADDRWEPNDECETLSILPDVEQDDEPWIINDAALYHADGASDVDWYFVTAEEGLGLCVPGFSQCGLAFTVSLTQPEDLPQADEMTLCVHTLADAQMDVCGAIETVSCSDDPSVATWDPATRTHSLTSVWDGVCGLDSSRDFLLEIRSDAEARSCAPYTLTMTFADTEAECAE